MGLTEAGNAIAKAINNPEMMRRLAMQLKIDPDTADSIQKIARAGNEAKARLMLMDIVQQKVGGAARAAFDSDPLSRFNKAIEGIQIKFGELSIKIQSKLAPVLEILGALTTKVIDRISESFGWFFGKLKEGDPIIMGITLAVGALTSAIITVTTVTKLWAAAQWLVSISNPAVLIIAGIVALTAVIAWVVYATEGWGKTWNNVINFCKAVFETFKAALQLRWLEIQDFFMKGIEMIEKGWYKLQSLWNKDAGAAGLKALEEQRNRRAEEIAKQRGVVDGFKDELNKMPIWEVKITKSFKDIQNDIGRKLGIAAPGVPGTAGAGAAGGGAVSKGATGGGVGKETAHGIATGGTKTTNIQIHIGEMGNNLKIYVDSIKEGAENIRNTILDELTRALAMAQGQI